MYYDVSSSNTLQDKIKFVVFTIYFIYSASSIKGKRDYNNSEINQFCSRLYARKRDYPLNRVFNVLRSTMLA